MYIELLKPSKLKYISLLCHQSKISSEVSIYINQPGEVCLTKLGGFSFNDNKRSNFQAREKKTVKVDCECEKIKFVFQINYENEINKFNQIGIIGLELYGEEISPSQIKILELQEEIKKLEITKKKAIEEENYDLAKETNNKITKYKNLIEQLTNGKISPDFDINEVDNKNNDNNNNISKNIENEEGKKRIVNKKKNVEKVSTGVSTRQDNNNENELKNQNDNNNRYDKSKSGAIDVDKQKVGNALTFSQMVEKELLSNSQFSPYSNNNSGNNNDNNQKITYVNKNNLTDDEQKFMDNISQFLPENNIYLLLSKNLKEMEKSINSIYEDLKVYNNDGQYKLFTNGISLND